MRSVKASYTALIVTLDNNYQNFHEPEALGLHKVLSKFSSIAALYLLDYVLPLVVKLSKTLQTKQLDLSMISSLVNAVIKSIDDAITPAANWILELLDHKDDILQATGEIITADKILEFQDKVGKPFVTSLKENIASRFASHDIVSALVIFDPHKVPGGSDLPAYGKESIEVLLDHFGKDKPACTLNEEETVKSAMITPDIRTEWITFRTLLAKKPEESMATQLQQLITNEMLATMFPNLSKIASIGQTIPVSTASVERSFSAMKQIKTCLHNSLSEGTLAQLMRIAIESPVKLTDDNLEAILEIWNRKPRRIPI